jgi:aspartyl-tRNA(Asn)/glutamyl-tRNA(Gln) amidotransferase subunit C
MALDPKAVHRIALLSRLQLGDQEAIRMSADLSSIVTLVDHLSEVEVRGVEPLDHPLEVFNVLADDVPATGLSNEAALSNAPQHDGESFLVPAVLG